ncbi:Protein of unknown function DUF668 [Macleaya cordata]|uniref:DUF668 domain-containing protein n=1 Tax=Macleaya cordata TaxID=56857 RepID=A0A200R592_MACCD|nr:Protein of unknown function DUF668 [Macleaya cordata]
MVMDSWWFRNLWRTSAKEPEKLVIGVLAFEVASLMSKVVHLWQSLSDKHVIRLREEIMNSVGVKKLVSDDDEFLVKLACAEIIENLGFLARSVARLGKKCSDPIWQRLDNVFDDLIKNDVGTIGWEFTWKKMERKVKKMGRFIALSSNLYQELEVLTELEQSLRRMQSSDDPNAGSVLEFQQKVVWQRQEVKNLREISLWNRTYDYVVRLLARSLFTIFGRIKHVFGIHQTASIGGTQDLEAMKTNHFPRSHSVSVHPSENNLTRFSSGPLGRSTTKSGPLSRSITKSGPISSAHIMNNKQWQTDDRSSNLHGKHSRPKTKRLTPVGPFKGCMMGGDDSPVLQSCTPVVSGSVSSNGVYSGILNGTKDANADPVLHNNTLRSNPIFSNFKCRRLNAPPSTLGGAALALHYANVIIIIEKLVASPHLIGPDARDDLYYMLPTSIRASLRARLKSYVKNLASSIYDTDLAAEWSEALARILEWLAPLAHNMIRWQSERNFEQQHLVSRTNVLLVQTLYFADLEKTEGAITELLVGLNYLWRFGRELNAKALLECASSGAFDDYLDSKG